MATPTKTNRQIIAAGTTVTAGGTQRGTLDMRTVFGGIATVKVANGATGPTVGATVNILCAHNTGATPAAGSAGTDWKTLYTVTLPTTNSGVYELSYDVPQGVMHLEVEVTGNTGQSVTAEAFLGEVTSIA